MHYTRFIKMEYQDINEFCLIGIYLHASNSFWGWAGTALLWSFVFVFWSGKSNYKFSRKTSREDYSG